MNAVQLLYAKEMRTAWRERGVWLGTLILPVLLGPVTLWLLVAAVGLATGQAERTPPRVGLWVPEIPVAEESDGEATSEWQDLATRLEHDPGLTVEVTPTPEILVSQLAGGGFDAFLEILPATGTAQGLAGNRRLRLTFDASRDRSLTARQQLLDHIDAYRDDLLERRGRDLGLSPSQWQVFALETRNLASGRDVGSFVLGLLVPLFTVIMVAIGCVFPAIESIAGERERQTWETSLGLGVPRRQVILAKYLYVATCGTLAGILNLIAVTLSMRAILAPVLGPDGAGLQFEIPWRAWPLIFLSTVLLAMFIAAGMMMFASFARSFKEGQAMVGPFLLLCLLPLLLVQSPDLRLDPLLAMVPIANVTLLFRQTISGSFPWGLIALTLIAEALWVVLCLRCSQFLVGFEELWLGREEGGLMAFLGRCLRKPKGWRAKEVR